MSATLTLVSHKLCPYVQRAAIVLLEKGIDFKRIDIDLSDKPAWFLDVSPLGKTPVLLVDQEPVFESTVICEYLDETVSPTLHPSDPLVRAQHRGWMEFGSALLNVIGAFYSASDEATLIAKASDIRQRFEQIEAHLALGPYFAGTHFCMVDAVFGPVFRYFDAIEKISDFGFFRGTPRVLAWRDVLASRPSVANAVDPDYPAQLHRFFLARGSALTRRIGATI